MSRGISPHVAGQVALLFTQESAAVFRTALQATGRDRTAAEDVVQETFKDAALQWDEIADFPPARKRAWLRRVAIRRAIDRYRADRRMDFAAEPTTTAASSSAEDVALTRLQADRCIKAIKEIPPMRRIVAYLRFRMEWDVSEISDQLGMRPSTVRVHIHEARGMLERAVGPEMTFTDDSDENSSAGEEEAR